MKELMIDYRNGEDENGEVKFERKAIDNMEFCVRDGFAYFKSEGKIYQLKLNDISQVYIG